MNTPRIALASILLFAIAGAAGTLVHAGPYDVRVGETRAVYGRSGTILRATPSKLGQGVATLPKGGRVVIREVKQPWVRVSAAVAGKGQVTGWLRTTETVEPQALNQAPRPAVAGRGGAPGLSQRDVSAAGRQLDAATERGYRAQRADLERAYRLVDQMEEETRRIDSSDSIAFIVGVALGRPNQDYVRPGLLPADPPRQPRRQAQRNPGRKLGGGLRGLGGLLGGSGGRELERLGRAAEEVSPYLEIMQDMQRQLSTSFTPQQEYYLGRAVAANAIAQYGVDPDPKRRAYVRLVGDAITRLSGRLQPNFGGYHFEVLNSDEINGISGPGGFVLLTRGAVEAAKSEDELASVLAHELGHIRMKHGETTLRKGRNFQSMVQGMGRGATQAAGLSEQELAGRLVTFFSQAVGELSRTSIENNYGRGAEFQADTEGTYILFDVRYDHVALQDYLKMLAARSGRAYRQSATHAPPQVRADALNQAISRVTAFPGSQRVRQSRIDRLNEHLGRTSSPVAVPMR